MISVAESLSETARPARARLSWWMQLIAVVLGTVALDSVSKYWALQVGQCCGGLVDPLSNDRFALGAGGGHQLMMAVVSASALVALVWWAARRPARIDGWPIGLVVGGGAANITDRIVQGQAGVTDFLNIANVIVINLADVAVLTGICAGALMLLRSHRRNIPHPHREDRGRHRGGSAPAATRV